MEKGLSQLGLSELRFENLANLEVTSDTIYRVALDSLVSGNAETLENTMRTLSENFERIINYLQIESVNNMSCYYFGRISSIVEFILDIIAEKEELKNYDGLISNYPLLLPALKIIKERNTISGVNLQKELKLKSSSNLSNFIKRIEKFDLISVHKIGTTNYFSLTLKGDQLLSKKANDLISNSSSFVKICEFFEILDHLSEEIGKNNSSSTRVILNSEIDIGVRETRILKQKLDRVFTKKEECFRNTIKSVNVKPSRMILYNSNFNFLDVSYDTDDRVYDTVIF